MFTAPSTRGSLATVVALSLAIPLDPSTSEACEPEAGRILYPDDGDTPPANTRILGSGVSDTLVVEYSDGGAIPGTLTTHGPIAAPSWIFTPATTLEAGRAVSVTLSGLTFRFTPTAAVDATAPTIITPPDGLAIHRARFVRVGTIADDVCDPPAVGDVWTTIGLEFPGRSEDETSSAETLVHRVRFEGQEVVWVGTQALRASCNGPLGRIQTVTSTSGCAEVLVEDAAGNSARVGTACLAYQDGGDFAFEERSCVDATPRDAGPPVSVNTDASGYADAMLRGDAGPLPDVGAIAVDAGAQLLGDDVEDGCTCLTAPQRTGLEALGGLGGLVLVALGLVRRRRTIV